MEIKQADLPIDEGLAGKYEEKSGYDRSSTEPRILEKGETFSVDGDQGFESDQVVSTAADLVTQIIKVEDDPSLNPWSFRMVFLGAGLSIFGGVLQEIFYFKPQTIYVSQVFLTVIAYILGEAMAYAIPRRGMIGRLLNPGPFNAKEHAAIALMSSAATQSALATEALSAQQLFYGGYPNHAAAIFIVLSSQLIGFGIAGLLRDVIVRPTKMIWPMTLPITTLLESIHKDKQEAKAKLKIFYIFFGALFVWTIIPEYIFPVLEGVSIFCLANQHSLVFTNLFGGASGNEGLGFLSLCFDWNYIASLGSPLWVPLYYLTNNLIGYIGCIVLFMGVYYGNIWRSQDFPFLSQLLYYGDSNSTNYNAYNQTLILNADYTVDPQALQEQGLPWLTGTYVAYLITSNMGLTATLTHMLLWNFDDIKVGWAWAAPSQLKKWLKPETYKFWANQETPEARLQRRVNDDSLDPHYRLMLRNLYYDTPLWWWGAVLLGSFAVGMGCLYAMKSTLPWWGFIIANLLTLLFMLFFGAQYGLTGFQFNVQPICQMLAGYMFPGKPLANLYFTCFTYNSLQQGQVLAKDLRLAQQVHLSPRCTFFVQVSGCIIGALFNYVMMLIIVQNQSEILLSEDGTNIWSGANVQIIYQFNSLAIAWSMAKDMFSIGGRYQWVTISYLVGFVAPVPFWLAHRFYPSGIFSYLNTSIILWYMGWLFVGINASIPVYFALGFGAQFWLRRYHPHLFNKYNYIVSAALDGGTQICVFILTFAVFGGSGTSHPFPTWTGNPDTSVHNLDYCMVNPATL
ncbi:OPT superfamily oligopeptide transporter [Aspergillus japonicus CBS 114.51]|uniref:OPT superfamily oligopeptide transporter n=2 Tax=Aspergillus TaxID=5052 RepID=A0A2V5GXL8_ASPV1|nr:OPT superfamily oligopeptide transporter [Aspergillus japonicus CBS 114.51]PYI13003.1 OPT superfamily oligopeptide transporter [Aspergillus violaceofuscus CBS 115571]RAH86596.1 OPT superfamily oligopeptide transporter [Aspergillus japonicus CBS 114.51]